MATKTKQYMLQSLNQPPPLHIPPVYIPHLFILTNRINPDPFNPPTRSEGTVSLEYFPQYKSLFHTPTRWSHPY